MRDEAKRKQFGFMSRKGWEKALLEERGCADALSSEGRPRTGHPAEDKERKITACRATTDCNIAQCSPS